MLSRKKLEMEIGRLEAELQEVRSPLVVVHYIRSQRLDAGEEKLRVPYGIAFE